MQCIQTYGNSSSDSESDHGESAAFFKPIDASESIASTLSLVTAPDVVPMVIAEFGEFFRFSTPRPMPLNGQKYHFSNLTFFVVFVGGPLQGNEHVSRVIDPTSKELAYNPKFEELYTPVQGPANPFLTKQQSAQRNTLSGFVEKAHISEFNFENQRRTFHTYGFALDPSTNAAENDGQTFVGDVQEAHDTNGKTVFEAPKTKSKRKQEKNDKPEDIEGFLGPWGKYENEESVARPNEQQKAELDEILAKRTRRNRLPEDKPVEEKSVLHSMYSIACSVCVRATWNAH